MSCLDFVVTDESVMIFGVGMAGGNDKIKVLFVCTGNSCRSQMAEGWARHLRGDVVEALSAGVSPASVNQMAIEVMAEAGIDIPGQKSKHIDELIGIDFDYVVTICDNAREHCPVFPGRTRCIHKSFEDPTLIPGTMEQVRTAFRKTRDAIRAFMETMPESLQELNKN